MLSLNISSIIMASHAIYHIGESTVSLNDRWCFHAEYYELRF